MSGELLRLGDWEYRTEPEQLLLPSSHAGEQAFRVRYRPAGGRVFRSFLLLGTRGDAPEPQVIAAAIAEHSAR